MCLLFYEKKTQTDFLANPIAATTYSKEGKESEARTGGWEWVVRDTQR